MEWFNWILRGGRKEVLPELFLDEPWLRQPYPDEQKARQVVLQLVDAGPQSLGELRLMNKASLREYLRDLLERSQTPSAASIPEKPKVVRVPVASPSRSH